MRYSGIRVVVAGGTGTVGSGVAQALLRQGASVVIATRSPEKYDRMRHSLPDNCRARLTAIEADVCTQEGALRLFDIATGQPGGVQHVVASLGGLWKKGHLVDQTLAEFKKAATDPVTGHFLLLQAFMPYLQMRKDLTRGSTYTIVSCNAGYKYLEPNTSLLSVSSGAINGLALAATTEYKECTVAVSEFRINCTVHRRPDNSMASIDPFNVGNDLIGNVVAAAIASFVHGKITINHRQEARSAIAHLLQ